MKHAKALLRTLLIATLTCSILAEVRAQDDDEAFLDMVQRATFDYFWFEANPENGLIKDRSTSGSPCSIAAVGFGLSAYTVGIDRDWITREEGIERVLATLRFFWNAPQSEAEDATGYRGFFYHFIDMQTGRRVWQSELSTVDTALLLGGILHMREYFQGDDPDEEEIRALADAIYQRVDWQWAQVRPPAISHGWRPESGFIEWDWVGYNEAMIVYILALGSPTFPVDSSAWDTWTSGYRWETHYGYTYLPFPPLFGHQYSHVWIDFRNIQDAYMRGKGIDYFENSRRATLAQRAYHAENPRGWPNYSENEWGITASDTPSGYMARGAPPAQRDVGTLVPTAPGGSIAFTPDESIAALRHMHDTYERLWGPYGFRDAYDVARNWFGSDYLGIDQGPILLMIENLRSENVWDSFMQHEAVQLGLQRAGFQPTDVAAERDVVPENDVSVSVYPNPASDRLFVGLVLPRHAHVGMELVDTLGRKISTLAAREMPAGRSLLELPIDELSAGTYYLRLQAGEQTLVRPFIKSP